MNLTILYSILSATGISALTAFTIKKTISRTIESRFNEIELKSKLQLEEIVRRQSKIFDDQYDSLKFVCSLIYRIRNSARDTLNEFTNPGSRHFREKQNLRLLEDTLQEVMFKDRGVLPESIFTNLHDLLHAISAFSMNMQLLKMNNEVEKKEYSLNNARKSFDQIEKHYCDALALYHSMVGYVTT
ncbi:MAG: hypothetical protein ACHQHN_06090 [Sphingobacteriales bacterium]